MSDHDVSRVPLQLVRHCIVASIQVDLAAEVLEQFRVDLLEMLHRTHAIGVVLDVSGIEVMDLEEFDALRLTKDMAGLMGARTIFSGFRAGVVSSLVELDADICSIDAAINLDIALEELIGATVEKIDSQEEGGWESPEQEQVLESGAADE